MDPRSKDPVWIGRYKVVRRLGEGGMGRVYLARRDGQRFAVKVIRDDIGADPTFRARFRREMRLAARVSSPFVVAVDDFGANAKRPWLATEYIDGPDLGRAMRSRGSLDESELLVLARSVLGALVAVHEQGIVHRDLKPENIIYAPDWPRVIDFGIAKVVNESNTMTLTPSGTLLGTLGYMSPEQVLNQEITPVSDMFSFGVLLTYAATGHNPFGTGDFRAIMFAVLERDPPLDDLPASIREIVGRCLAKDPSSRLDAATALERIGPIERTTSALGGNPGDHPTETIPPTTVLPTDPVRGATVVDPIPSDPVQPVGNRTQRRHLRPRADLGQGLKPGFVRVGVTTLAIVVVAAVLPWVISVIPTLLESDQYGAEVVAEQAVSGRAILAADGTSFATDYTSSVDILRRFVEVGGVDGNDSSVVLDTDDHDFSVRYVVGIAPNGESVAMETDEGILRWNADGDGSVEPIVTYEGEVTCEDRSLFSGWFGIEPDIECESTVPDERYPDYVVLAPDGASLVSGGGDQTTVREPDGSVRAALGGEESTRTHAAAVTSDGALVATADEDTVGIWDFQSGERLGEVETSAWDLAFAPDGTHLATAGENGAQVWDTESGDHVRTIFDYESLDDESLRGEVAAVAYSPDGAQIATGHGECDGGSSCDYVGHLRVWDAETGEQVANTSHDSLRSTVEGQQNEDYPPSLDNRVTQLAFIADTGQLSSVDTFGSVVLWQLE